ncbi:MAG TPA: ISNCY family transposase [Thermodesulfobacteriota bacterium]|nr:ISNCY family transposase [Thermodesulfobacteriota bacterium]
MAGEGIIMASQEELRRLHVIQKVLEGGLRQVEAAELLSLSSRHIRRVVRRVWEEGQRGIVHRSRGRPSNRKIPDRLKDRVIKLYQTIYKGFGPTLASEKLLERDGVSISDETLRNWLIESGDWKRVRKGRRHRQWRERKGHRGEMVQIDGSHHAWFEDRGDPCVLMGYIDDAMGDVFGRFYDHEGTMPAMDSFKRYIRKRGLPLRVYLDKHSTYKSTAKATIEEQLEGMEPLSEFERALKELGVEVSHAHSPQAKGRIERLFRTFQDRVVKEMRLRGIKTIEEGNQFLEQYLPLYNKRFSVPPREKQDVHRPLPRGIDLDAILCMKTERTLRNDFTVAHNHKLYQIEEATKASKVIVQDRMDGSMRVTYQGRALRFREIAERPQKENQQFIGTRRRKTYIPPADHPWRRFKIKNHHHDGKRFLESQI